MRKYALPLALLADIVLIIIFAAVGRNTHEKSNAALGALDTAWPFLVGLAVGWLLCLAAKWDAIRPWPAGVILWVCTIAVGIVLRKVTGDGTAVAFVIVATCFNFATLVGWRLLGLVMVRRRG